MMQFAIYLKKDCSLVSSNMEYPPAFEELPISGDEKTRAYTYENTFFTISLFSGLRGHLENASAFKKAVVPYVNLIDGLEKLMIDRDKKLDDQFRKLRHNIKGANGRVIQETDDLITSKSCENGSDFLKQIQHIVVSDPRQVASLIASVRKNSFSIKDELSVFELFFNDNPDVRPRQLHVHQYITGIMNSYFSDLNSKGITWSMGSTYQAINVDHSCFGAILRHLMDNAMKYCLPSTQIKFFFNEEEGVFSIKMQMISLEVLPKEAEEIFKDGVSGEQARNAGLNGDGIGLHIVKRLCDLNGIKIEFHPGSFYRSVEENGLKKRYATNDFILSFN